MSDHRQIDRALGRIAAARKAKAPPAPRSAAATSMAQLVKHAERFGPDGVLYTAHTQGFAEGDMLTLAEILDKLRCKIEGKYAKALTQPQLARLVSTIGGYIR